jgi:hypothetical protein
VRADRGRIRDHLVLEARVELHVPDLVDELRRQEAALLLVVLGEHESAELRRDPLLGDHQGAQHPVEKRSFLLGELPPIRPVACEIDVLRRPVRAFPVLIELLRGTQAPRRLRCGSIDSHRWNFYQLPSVAAGSIRFEPRLGARRSR